MIIYNTLGRKKAEFTPLKEGEVNMYVCGITAYDYCHIGHARSALVFDVLVRRLRHLGFKVRFIRNFTDVDDKIINRANTEGRDWREIGRTYIDAFHEDMDALGVLRADVEPRATDHIQQIQELCRQLIDLGKAYATPSGDVYFRVRAYPPYGKLSGRNLDEMRAGERVKPGEEKEDPLDFAVWKAAKPGEPSWESPWGKGRPGWHIECSAMSRPWQPLDIHGGGQDLIFPHHENEIVQTKGACGCELANYWMHNGMLETKGSDGKTVKMSKSLKNFFKVDDVAKQFDKYTIRFYYLNTHYRSPLTYGEEFMAEAQAALKRLWNNYRDLQACARDGPSGSDEKELVEASRKEFTEAMDDDFNTRAAIESLFSLARTTNKMMAEKTLSKEGAASVLAYMDEVNDVLGILPEEEASDNGDFDAIMAILIDLRKELRAKKQYDLADMIRDRLKDAGYAIEDSSDGAKWKKL